MPPDNIAVGRIANVVTQITAAFGSFVALIPAPLSIGTVSLEDGTSVKGLLCEVHAVKGAENITSFGGWRELAEPQNTRESRQFAELKNSLNSNARCVSLNLIYVDQGVNKRRLHNHLDSKFQPPFLRLIRHMGCKADIGQLSERTKISMPPEFRSLCGVDMLKWVTGD